MVCITVDTHIQNDDPEKALEVAATLDQDATAVKVKLMLRDACFSECEMSYSNEVKFKSSFGFLCLKNKFFLLEVL